MWWLTFFGRVFERVAFLATDPGRTPVKRIQVIRSATQVRLSGFKDNRRYLGIFLVKESFSVSFLMLGSIKYGGNSRPDCFGRWLEPRLKRRCALQSFFGTVLPRRSVAWVAGSRVEVERGFGRLLVADTSIELFQLHQLFWSIRVRGNLWIGVRMTHCLGQLLRTGIGLRIWSLGDFTIGVLGRLSHQWEGIFIITKVQSRR